MPSTLTLSADDEREVLDLSRFNINEGLTDPVYSVSSSDPSIAETALNGSILEITIKKPGQVQITIRAGNRGEDSTEYTLQLTINDSACPRHICRNLHSAGGSTYSSNCNPEQKRKQKQKQKQKPKPKPKRKKNIDFLCLFGIWSGCLPDADAVRHLRMAWANLGRVAGQPALGEPRSSCGRPALGEPRSSCGQPALGRPAARLHASVQGRPGRGAVPWDALRRREAGWAVWHKAAAKI